jgi:magnesium-transporting ATPase (P-type)
LEDKLELENRSESQRRFMQGFGMGSPGRSNSSPDINNTKFSNEITQNIQQEESLMDARNIIQDKNAPEYKPLVEVMTHLALCHTVIIDTNTGEYNASSPDELALVEGAKSHGFELINRDHNNVIELQVPAWGYSATRKFKVLNVLEFNSDRKRMSVIVEDL